MGIVRRGMRNPIRLSLLVILLETSLLLVAAMVAFDANTQARIDEINGQVGTGIKIIPSQGRVKSNESVTDEVYLLLRGKKYDILPYGTRFYQVSKWRAYRSGRIEKHKYRGGECQKVKSANGVKSITC